MISLHKALARIVGKVENQYAITAEGNADQPYFVARADVRAGDIVFPCDTSIQLDLAHPQGSERAIFATLIHDGVSGENKPIFGKAIDALNYIYPGKFVHDVSDRSQDILYTTTERVTGLSAKVVAENLDHHAQVKAQVTPELGHLQVLLGLDSKSTTTQAEQYAENWVKHFIDSTSLAHGPQITYLPLIDL